MQNTELKQELNNSPEGIRNYPDQLSFESQ